MLIYQLGSRTVDKISWHYIIIWNRNKQCKILYWPQWYQKGKKLNCVLWTLRWSELVVTNMGLCNCTEVQFETMLTDDLLRIKHRDGELLK